MLSITDVMRLLQFGDSALPIGSFSFSNGVESAVQQRLVRDPESLREFILTAVHQSASGDGIALLEAHRALRAGDLERIMRADRAIELRKLNEESRAMTSRVGRKLGDIAARVVSGPVLRGWLDQVRAKTTPGTQPVGIALLFASLDLPEDAAFAAHQYGVTTMMLGAALRLMRLTHLESQSILFAVNGTVSDQYARIATASLDDMATFAPLSDILAAVHVKAHVRLFMN